MIGPEMQAVNSVHYIIKLDLMPSMFMNAATFIVYFKLSLIFIEGGTFIISILCQKSLPP